MITFTRGDRVVWRGQSGTYIKPGVVFLDWGNYVHLLPLDQQRELTLDYRALVDRARTEVDGINDKSKREQLISDLADAVETLAAEAEA